MSATTFHLPFLSSSDEFEVVGVSTRRAEVVRAERPNLPVYATAEQLIDQVDADLVIITAPNDVHAALTRRALEAGRHVLVEKPFVVHSEQGFELIALAEKAQRVLSVFHNRRWDGDFLTLRRIMDDGVVGKVQILESRFDRFRPQVRERWREQPGEGAGIWYDLGPHLVDQALCLFGVPDAVTACLRALRHGSSVCDYFHVQFHYADKEVQLGSRPFTASPNLRFQLLGDLGTFVKYGFDPQEERLKQGCIPIADEWARDDAARYGQLYGATDGQVVPTELGGYQQFFRGLADAVQGQGPPPVTAAEALAVIQLLELAERSHAARRTLNVDASAWPRTAG